MISLEGGSGCAECGKLRDECGELREENRILRAELEKLRGENEKLRVDHHNLKERIESIVAASGWYKPAVKKDGKKKRSGRKKGHKGAGRRRPDHVDKVVPVTLKACPKCGGDLGEPSSSRSRFVYDLPPPPPAIVIEYLINRYWCRTCKKLVEDRPELPYARIGTGVWAWVYVFHHTLNVSFDKIAWMLHEVWNITLTKSTLINGLNARAKKLEAEYEQTMEEIRNSPYCHIDETGNRVNGEKWWTWIFRSAKKTYYHTIKSRGKQVPQTKLGDEYTGTIISDDLPIYPPLHYNKQADWVHLIRKARDLTEKKDTHPEHKQLYRGLQRIYRDLKKYHRQYHATPPPQEERKKYHTRIARRLRYQINKPYETIGAQKVQKRIERRFKDYLTCTLHPHVPPNNNPAEQGLKPWVMHRKTSSLRSTQSAKTHDILLTHYINTQQETLNPILAAQKILAQIYNPSQN